MSFKIKCRRVFELLFSHDSDIVYSIHEIEYHRTTGKYE